MTGVSDRAVVRCSGATGLLRQPLPICTKCQRRQPAKANQVTWQEWIPGRIPGGWACSGQIPKAA